MASEEDIQQLIEARDDVVLRDIQFRSKVHMMPQAIAREYAVKPQGSAQSFLICDAPSKPPLLLRDCEGVDSVYDMGPDFAGPVRATLHLRSTREGSDFDCEIPLRMLPYQTPEDPKLCFDLAVCHKVDRVNETRTEHNRYVCSLLSMFVKDNGCGTSANHITLPSPPDVLTETRAKRLNDIFKDKYGSTVLAVKYLAARERYCCKDYEPDKAVDMANEVAYQEAIQQRVGAGKVRVKIPGSRYTNWDGDEGHRDSAGRRVKWSKGKYHSFLSPEVEIVLARDELVFVST